MTSEIGYLHHVGHVVHDIEQALWVRTGLWERIAAILHPDPAQTEPAASS